MKISDDCTDCMNCSSDCELECGCRNCKKESVDADCDPKCEMLCQKALHVVNQFKYEQNNNL
jgi:hypothetical protein